MAFDAAVYCLLPQSWGMITQHSWCVIPKEDY